MALVSAGGRWLRVNHAVTEILGYSETQLLEIDFQSITHPEDLDADLVFVREMLEGSRQSYRMEKRYLHRDGQVVWVLLSVSLVRDDAGGPVHFISQLQDITERKRAEAEVGRQTRELQELNRKLEELAMVDPLTRVFNRRAFAQRLEAEISHSARTGMPLSLLLVDVDHFKRFNDEFGHPAGDKALKRVADGLVDAGRVNDVVARYGGEEFAVILPNTDASGSRIVAERMRSAITAIAGVPRPLRASLGGVSVHPARGGGRPVTAASLIRLADEALYAAKANGRNRCEHAETIG
jgi:diguanylate cyclase (GGDEF)-like protein/PAS domain S-box-containing protein